MSGKASFRNWPFTDALYVLSILAFVAVATWIHMAAGFTFPVPWPDEAVFVQQAISFQQHNSLLSPYLSESRHILWMPPGYMIVLGVLFKIAGSGLFTARLISFILTVGIFGVLVTMFRNHPARFHFLFLASFFFLDRFFVIMGNTARMEPLLMLGVVTALALFRARKPNAALSVLLVLPLIHPNGMYFLCAGIGFILVQNLLLKEKVEGTRTDRMLLAAALLLVAGYILFALFHWSDFLRDMSFQFVRKSRRNLAAPLLTTGNLVFLSLSCAGLMAALIRKEAKLVVLGLFAIASWCVNKIGQEMWYQVFDAWAVLLLMMMIIELCNPARKTMIFTIFTLCAVYMGRQLEMIESLKGYPQNVRWYGMGFPERVDYFNRHDAERIRTSLADHQTGTAPVRTMIFPSADALLLQDLEGGVLRSLYVAQDSSVFPVQQHDLYLVHMSRYCPIGWDWSFYPWVLEDAKIDTADKKNLLFERDGTEQWYYRFVKTPADSIPRTQ
ncbi:MAG: hypothetical protein NTU47_04675 [Ignavibacteriales bacterium]|nr:hypothetical protein [Ignavibacteriales bacterium]